MTSLSDIQEKLLDTQAFISRLEQRLSVYPDSEHLIGNLRSAQKRQRVLEQAFAREANKAGVEVCSYRLFAEGGMPSITALAKALDSFQTLISSVYSALKNGPKKRGRLSKEIVKETSLSFGYAFSGSVGMVLTLPTSQPFHSDSKWLLDQSIDVFFHLAKATTTLEISEFVNQIGHPPIKALSEWAKALTDHDLGADIEWEGPHEVKNSLFIQTPELQHLSKISAEMSVLKSANPSRIRSPQGGFLLPTPAGENLPKMESEVVAGRDNPTEEEIEVEGLLVGVDVYRQTFHMKFPTGNMITGTFTNDISPELPLEIPKLYRARLRKTTEGRHPTDEYLLLALDPLPLK